MALLPASQPLLHIAFGDVPDDHGVHTDVAGNEFGKGSRFAVVLPVTFANESRGER
jgi:hypothetical protein